MTSDAYRKLLESQEGLKRALDPNGAMEQLRRLTVFDEITMRPWRDLQNQIRSVVGAVDASGITALAAQAKEHQRLLSALSGYTDLTSCKLEPGVLSAAREIAERHRQFVEMFRLPEIAEASRLMREAHESVTAAARLYGLDRLNRDLENAVQSMHAPWLNSAHELQSIASFAEIQAMGQAVNSEFPFAAGVASGLRHALGDWRDVTRLPNLALDNPVTRSDFYVGLGFNPALTDLPAPAFDESTALAGLTKSLIGLEEPQDEDEDELDRNQEVYRQIFLFERKLRRFIDQLMTAACGADWIKHRTPAGMMDAWIEKRLTAVAKGEAEQPLIFYADFSDYIKIIERKDNWAEVFKPVFGRSEDVRESFARVAPIRIITMHARLITLDDELLLRVETTRILRAIRKAQGE